MKTKSTFNKSFIVILLILFLFFLVFLNLSNKPTFNSEKFDSYKEMHSKLLSKKALENFIIEHRAKDNFKYTKDIVMPLLADKKEYNPGFADELASNLTGTGEYTITFLKLENSKAYYKLEMPVDPPSKGEPDFIFAYSFKLIEKDNKWDIQKICFLCEINEL